MMIAFFRNIFFFLGRSLERHCEAAMSAVAIQDNKISNCNPTGLPRHFVPRNDDALGQCQRVTLPCTPCTK